MPVREPHVPESSRSRHVRRGDGGPVGPVMRCSYEPGARGGIRTHDLRLRRPTLYPAELRARLPVETDQSAPRGARIVIESALGCLDLRHEFSRNYRNRPPGRRDRPRSRRVGTQDHLSRRRQPRAGDPGRGSRSVQARRRVRRPRETIESVERTRLVLKGPLGTPVGYGNKSANVTLRKLFETFANIRPVRELPGVEDALHRPGPRHGRRARERGRSLRRHRAHGDAGVAQCLKIITRQGCEKIARFAFEYAVAEGGKRSTAPPSRTS